MQVLALARHLTTNYGQDERVTRLLNTTEVPHNTTQHKTYCSKLCKVLKEK